MITIHINVTDESEESRLYPQTVTRRDGSEYIQLTIPPF